MSYRFEGYWKDVGTIQSLWEANMDLIDNPPKFDLNDREWIIYSRNYALMPHYIGEDALITRSTVTEGCDIDGKVDHSVIFSGVKIGKGAVIRDAVVMPGAVIGEGAIVEKSVIGPNVVIGDNVKIGVSDDRDDNPYKSQYCTDGIVLIEGGAVIESGADIPKGSMVQI
jgi:glucose-1-phosphate adenylyltransferase